MQQQASLDDLIWSSTLHSAICGITVLMNKNNLGVILVKKM